MPELFKYLDEAKRIVEELKEGEFPEEVLKPFCIAWQYQKNCIKAKKPERRNKYKEKEREELELLEAELGEEFQELKETIYSQLDNIVQTNRGAYFEVVFYFVGERISRSCFLNWFRKTSGRGGVISNLIFKPPRNGSDRDLLWLSLSSSTSMG